MIARLIRAPSDHGAPGTFGAWVGDGLHRLPPRLHTLVPAAQRADLRHLLGRYYPWEEGFDRTPPPHGPELTTGPPDFVGVGSTLAGATWWYRLIVDHPDVSAPSGIGMARHYLSHFCTDGFGPDQVQDYHGWFPRRPGTITGEWTPGYMALPWVPPLLARAAPVARLLVMVRDPVQRLVRSLDRPLDEGASQVGSHIADAVDRGFYARQLRTLFGCFGRDQILVVQYERCLADPAGQLAATYRFLQVDATYRPGRLDPPERWAASGPSRVDPDALRRLVGIYRSDVADLAQLVPDLDLSLWPDFDRGSDSEGG